MKCTIVQLTFRLQAKEEEFSWFAPIHVNSDNRIVDTKAVFSYGLILGSLTDLVSDILRKRGSEPFVNKNS